MDAGAIQTAYIGTKYAIDTLRTVAGIKTKIEADARRKPRP
jgi:hypothetical protein